MLRYYNLLLILLMNKQTKWYRFSKKNIIFHKIK